MIALTVDIERKAFRAPGLAEPLVALADMRFAVAERARLCLVGPSGCGKTTLLNLISGLDRDFTGAIGNAANGAGAPIGYMFQSPRLMPWLSVRENVRLALPRHGPGDRRAERILEEMQLAQFLDAYPRQLSGGMQRRVALARAFVAEPRLMLLDEPFSSLDAPAANRLRGLLLDLWRRRPTTILFVTHDLREALFVADRILFMSSRPGRVLLDLPVNLPLPRDPEGPDIEAMRRRLLADYPNLLQGLLGGSADTGGGDDVG